MRQNGALHGAFLVHLLAVADNSEKPIQEESYKQEVCSFIIHHFFSGKNWYGHSCISCTYATGPVIHEASRTKKKKKTQELDHLRVAIDSVLTLLGDDPSNASVAFRAQRM